MIPDKTTKFLEDWWKVKCLEEFAVNRACPQGVVTVREEPKAHENLTGITKHSQYTAVHLQEILENLESCKEKKHTVKT